MRAAILAVGLVGLVAHTSERVGALTQDSRPFVLSGRNRPDEFPIELLRTPLSDGIETLRVHEHPESILVSLWGPSALEPERLSPDDIQVWLLKVDGTTVARLPGVFYGAGGRSSDARRSLSTGYKFERVPHDQLAGVAVRFKGKLLVREIKLKP
jgi:hypothetical protein